MADVKDGDIVFEYPDDDEIPGSKLPDEKEVDLSPKEAEPKNEIKVEAKVKDDDIDLGIVTGKHFVTGKQFPSHDKREVS